VDTKTRIAGIIIQDGKLLMLLGKGYKELWTPGGKIDDGETDEECLRRELKEEIGVDLAELKFFKEYSNASFYHPENKIIERSYVIKIKGDIKADAEIDSVVWLSLDDYHNKKFPMINHTQEELIPDLIEEGIW
jgi:8-oxo-dGTP diphosphatase